MRDVTSLFPPYLQVAINYFSFVANDIYILTPISLACRQFWNPAAMPVMVFSVSLIGTKLVIKHLSSYSNEGLGTLKKCIRHLSRRLLLVQVIAAIATLILIQVVPYGLLVMAASGAFFGLINAVNNLGTKEFVKPKTKYFDHKRE